MTWDASKPASNESPSLAPAQIQTNWSRLFSMINADHVFNATADTDDGYHNVMHWVTQVSSPGYINATGQTFAKDATVTLNGVNQTAPQLFHRTSDGVTTRELPLSTAPVLAYVNFNGTVAGNNAAQTIRSQYNVTSVTRFGTATGRYTVNFATSLPSDAYAVSVTGMKDSSGEIIAYVEGSATYTDIVKVGSLGIGFENRGGTAKDVTMGCVIVFGG